MSFKYQEKVSHEELMAIAGERLQLGDLAVVANQGEEASGCGEAGSLLGGRVMRCR